MRVSYSAMLEFKGYFQKLDYKYIKIGDRLYHFFKKDSSIIVKLAFCFIRNQLEPEEALCDLFNDELPDSDEKQLWIYEAKYNKFQHCIVKGSASAIILIKGLK